MCIRFLFATYGKLSGTMKVAELLLAHYDQEINNIRRIFEFLPDGKFRGKQHEKSMKFSSRLSQRQQTKAMAGNH
jgi:hypothetical protein